MRRRAASHLARLLVGPHPTCCPAVGGPAAWAAPAAPAATQPGLAWASTSAPSPSSSIPPPPRPPPPCWSCGGTPTPAPPPAIFCGLCRLIQPPCPHADHFSILGVPRTFDLDLRALETAHRRLQAVAHPDRFARASDHERSHSAELSARANAAYAVLKSPLLRARYMLGGTVDGEAEDDTADATDPDLLLEVMEAREAVEEAPPGSPALAALDGEYKARAAALVAELSGAFAAGDTAAAADAVMRLRYVTRIQQAIADKE